ARRDGEVHLLPAAPVAGAPAHRDDGPAARRRPGAHRLPGRVSHGRDPLRRPRRPERRRAAHEGIAAPLRTARRAGHAAADHLPGARRARAGDGAVSVDTVRHEPPRSRDVGVLHAGWGYASITDKIADLVLTQPLDWRWLLAFCVTLAGTLMLAGAVAYL